MHMVGNEPQEPTAQSVAGSAEIAFQELDDLDRGIRIGVERRKRVAIAFQELDDLDKEMDGLKSKASMQYAVLEAAGIPRKVAKLARQVSAMTEAERRAFDSSLSLARNCLDVQAELDLGSP